MQKDDIKDPKEMSPSEYFDLLKGKRQKITDNDLSKFYDNSMSLLNKYMITGQIAAIKKLIFLIETVEKERKLVKLGINTFVYRDDIEDYIDHIAKDVVKIIELERYEREIPDEIVEVISKTKELFDKMYIVFTDYTGKAERQVAREKRAKDPILFGTFQNEETRILVERFYFLGDWEDEYCDLTLDKLVSQMEKQGKKIEHKISTPDDIEKLKEELAKLTPTENSYKVEEKDKKKKSIFRNIRIRKKKRIYER